MPTIFILIALVIIYLSYSNKYNNYSETKEHYYNSSSSASACPSCTNYSNYLHLNDDCYLRHLYNVKQTNLLAKLYDNERYCGLGYYQL